MKVKELLPWLFPDSRAAEPAPPSDELTILAENVREDAPQWRRTYTAKLTDEVTIQVDYHSYSTSTAYRMCGGELRQRTRNGWVLFDPKNPADKILDRELLPKVLAVCKAAQALDDEFMGTKRCEFTDKVGDKWRKTTAE